MSIWSQRGKTWQIWGSFTFSLFQEWRWFSGNNRDGTLGNCSGIKFITTLVNHKRSIRSMICMFAFVTRVGKMCFFYLLGIIGRPFRTGGEDFPGALAGWIWGPLVCTMNFQQIALGPREFSLLKILQVRKKVGYLLNYISHSRVCGSTKPFFGAQHIWCTGQSKRLAAGICQHSISNGYQIADTHPAGTEKDGGQGCIGGHNVSG